MNLTDTHTHLYTEEFDNDRPQAVLRAKEAGIRHLLLPNIDANSVGPMLQMCDDYPDLCRPMMGLHPTELPQDPAPVLDLMAQMLARSAHPFVAVGEVGIDLYWDSSRREEQMAVFERQAQWACCHNLPLVVHTRQAHAEVMEVLSPLRNQLCGGVFHCFGGTEEEALNLLSFPGFVLGIGGVVTFKKSHLPAVLRSTVPLERIVLETDSPYLAPTPHRGKRNESAYLPLVAQKLAEIYGCTPEHVAETTTQTAEKLFRLT